MNEEWGDFVTMWEQRLLAVALPYLEPEPTLIPGSAEAEFSDDSGIVVVVNPGQEMPARSGFWQCEVIVQYDYARGEAPEDVSRRWGQILEAFGNGVNNADPLRTRLAQWPLVIKGGINSVLYNRPILTDHDNRTKQFSFEVGLGLAVQAA